MIVRVFRAVVHEGRQDAFREFFLNTALPLVEKQAGIVSVTPGLPRPETPTEFSMIMVWQSVDALKGFAGEDWREAHIHPDAADKIREWSVHHYELAG